MDFLDLPTLWAFILAFAVFAYVVLDGFDLGIGILFPTLERGRDRDHAMNSVAPVWDGNETWLVLGGGGLLAAFPLAYAVVMPALYAPIITMLLALIFRGVAFEFRWRDPAHQRFWDVSFAGGSIMAAFAQGVTLGALLQGITVEGRGYAGGWWEWLSPFSLLTGVSLVIGYALLGSTWLIMKTEGSLQDHAFRYARIAGIATVLCIAAVSLATPFLEQAYYQRWFAWPSVLFTAQVPLLVAIAAIAFFVCLQKRYERLPFLLALALFAISMVGLGVSIFPDIVPGAISIHDAAAPESSLVFMLIGAGILVPIILAYTAYSYWIFRGKVGHEGYH
jgi:cytochrome d ubiquinol oxidase subunit II